MKTLPGVELKLWIPSCKNRQDFFVSACEEDNFDLICIQEQMHSPWSKPDNNGRNKRTSDANYSSCNNISTGFSCLPLDYKTGISHRNPEETLSITQDTAYFNYLKTGFVNLPRLESYITATL